MKDSKDNTKTRIESKLEVNTYLQKLKYALDHDAQIAFQARRLVDKKREIYYNIVNVVYRVDWSDIVHIPYFPVSTIINI